MDAVTTWMHAHAPLSYYAAAAAALITLIAVVRIRKAARRVQRTAAISILINIAAVMATSVQASGMWKFFGNTMGLPVGFRIVLFGFMEIALLASGLRARANVEEGGDAGIDGVLVWVLALASGLMSSTDASTLREALMRILVAVVVSLLWTRDLMAAKRAARKAASEEKKTGPIRWRITGERVFVWLRLADAVDTDISAIDAGRRVSRYLKAMARTERGPRWPFTAKARAERQEQRMTRVALVRSNPVELLKDLEDRAFARTRKHLGIDSANANPGDNQATVASPRQSPTASRPLATADNLATAANDAAPIGDSPALSPTDNRDLATVDSRNLATADNPANGNGLPPVANRQPRPVASETTGATEALVGAMEPVYRQILATTGKRPTAPQLVDGLPGHGITGVPGLNTPSRAKQIRDVLEARFPDLAPRLKAVEPTWTGEWPAANAS